MNNEPSDNVVEDPDEQEEIEVPRDRRAMIVAITGLGVIFAIALAAFLILPGPVPTGQTSTKSENIVAIASAALTAVGTVIAAYFGIRAANLAREESTQAAERGQIQGAALAGAQPGETGKALGDATNQIRARGLVPGSKPRRRGRRR